MRYHFLFLYLSWERRHLWYRKRHDNSQQKTAKVHCQWYFRGDKILEKFILLVEKKVENYSSIFTFCLYSPVFLSEGLDRQKPCYDLHLHLLHCYFFGVATLPQ